MSNQTEKKEKERERKGKRRRENKQANNNKRKQKEKQGREEEQGGGREAAKAILGCSRKQSESRLYDGVVSDAYILVAPLLARLRQRLRLRQVERQPRQPRQASITLATSSV